MDTLTFFPVGDSAVAANFGNTITPDINKRIRQVMQSFNDNQLIGIIELVPTYCSLLIQYDPMEYTYGEMCSLIKTMASESLDTASSDLVRVVELPTVYGGEFGPDMNFVCKHTGFSEHDLIALHSGTDYLVYMLGFIPGFTYLGGMDERLATPRLKTPRTLIPAGSVGIAGSQTGTYPTDSPGGWQIIGRTPLTLYDGSKENPTLLSAGDYCRYVPITSDEYYDIQQSLDRYEPVVHLCKEDELRGQK